MQKRPPLKNSYFLINCVCKNSDWKCSCDPVDERVEKERGEQEPLLPPSSSSSLSSFSFFPSSPPFFLLYKMSVAFDDYGRPFIVLRQQGQKERLKGIEAHKSHIIAARFSFFFFLFCFPFLSFCTREVRFFCLSKDSLLNLFRLPSKKTSKDGSKKGKLFTFLFFNHPSIRLSPPFLPLPLLFLSLPFLQVCRQCLEDFFGT